MAQPILASEVITPTMTKAELYRKAVESIAEDIFQSKLDAGGYPPEVQPLMQALIEALRLAAHLGTLAGPAPTAALARWRAAMAEAVFSMDDCAITGLAGYLHCTEEDATIELKTLLLQYTLGIAHTTARKRVLQVLRHE